MNMEKIKINNNNDLDELIQQTSVQENLSNFDFFKETFKRNQEATSRTAKGKVDTSVSETKQKSKLSGVNLIEQVGRNQEQLAIFVWGRSQQEIKSAQDIEDAIKKMVQIINNNISEDPQALRTWDREVPHGRQVSPEKIPEEMENFYQQCFEKIALVQQEKMSAAELAAWVELEINKNIHPFADGCGRTSKGLSTFILNHFRFPLPDYGNRDEYFAAMDKGLEYFQKEYYQACIKRSIQNNYEK